MAGFKRLVPSQIDGGDWMEDREMAKCIKELKDALPSLKGKARLAVSTAILDLRDPFKEQRVVETPADARKLKAIRAAGYSIRARTRSGRIKAARAMHRLLLGGELRRSLASFLKADARLKAVEYREGGSGACLLHAELKGKGIPPVILKTGNAGAEVFGARLAQAVGMKTPAFLHVRPKTGKPADEFILIENIRNYEGRKLGLRSFMGEHGSLVRAVGILEDDVIRLGAGRRSAAALAFWKLVGTDAGRRSFMDAWLDFHEFSRLAMLCDRKGANAVAVFSDRTAGGSAPPIHILPVDFDPITFTLARGRDGKLDPSSFNIEFAHHTFGLLCCIARNSAKAHRQGLINAPFKRKTLVNEMAGRLMARRDVFPAGYPMLKRRVIREILAPRNRGSDFGMRLNCIEQKKLSSANAARLRTAVESIAARGERLRFIGEQIAVLRQLDQTM